MNSPSELAEALGAADQLDIEGQAELVAVLSQRLTQQGISVESFAFDETELLPDPGRVRMPGREIRTITAKVINAGRQVPRLRTEAE